MEHEGDHRTVQPHRVVGDDFHLVVDPQDTIFEDDRKWVWLVHTLPVSLTKRGYVIGNFLGKLERSSCLEIGRVRRGDEHLKVNLQKSFGGGDEQTHGPVTTVLRGWVLSPLFIDIISLFVLARYVSSLVLYYKSSCIPILTVDFSRILEKNKKFCFLPLLFFFLRDGNADFLPPCNAQWCALLQNSHWCCVCVCVCTCVCT